MNVTEGTLDGDRWAEKAKDEMIQDYLDSEVLPVTPPDGVDTDAYAKDFHAGVCQFLTQQFRDAGRWAGEDWDAEATPKQRRLADVEDPNWWCDTRADFELSDVYLPDFPDALREAWEAGFREGADL